MFRLFLVCLTLIFSFIHLHAGSSFYVTVTNDTVWGTGIWPEAGFDEQKRIMFIDVDSNLHEISPDSVFFVIIEKAGYHEVFKSTKTDIWGMLFLHQIIIGDVAVLWGYDFDATSPQPADDNGYMRSPSAGSGLTVFELQRYVAKKLKDDPYPDYNDDNAPHKHLMYYLQKNEGKAIRIYDLNFKKQMGKCFAGNAEVMEMLRAGKLKYSNIGRLLSRYYFIPQNENQLY